MAHLENRERMRSKRSSGVSPSMSATAAIAPALIIALRGRPVVGCTEISWNASPEGSTSISSPTASMPRSASASPYVNAFEIDWIVKSRRVSPTSYR